MKIHIYGMHDQLPAFSIEELAVIKACRYFAGGKRHYDLVKALLPQGYHWQAITVPMQTLFDKMHEESAQDWVVFASGDPLFYGVAITLQKQFPHADMHVKSVFNSLQLLAHELQLPYGEYTVVTLTGRPWQAFDAALMANNPKIALLTDRKKTPKAIAQRMLEAGYDNYQMHLGEKMGGANQRIRTLLLRQAIEVDFEHPNCLFLEQTQSRPLPKGISERDFETLAGRPNMITKMPIRMATLALMHLQKAHTLWDVGACSGSISIEARLNHPHLEVHAFEIRPECEGIIQRNAKRFGVPGLRPVMGDFTSVDKSDLPAPDAAFIGGYGGDMEGVFKTIDKALIVGGCIAFNAVSDKSIAAFEQCVDNYPYTMSKKTVVAVDEHNAITIMVAIKEQ